MHISHRSFVARAKKVEPHGTQQLEARNPPPPAVGYKVTLRTYPPGRSLTRTLKPG